MSRLEEIFASKRRSTERFRLVQVSNQVLTYNLVNRADWKTREGTIELHKGLHWINLELYEVIHAADETMPEEIADVLHFLVEFTLLLGYDEVDVISETDLTHYQHVIEAKDRLDAVVRASFGDPFTFEEVRDNARFMILSSLAIADLLKNKPWKQTVKTEIDEGELKGRIRGLWYWFGAVARTGGLDADQVYEQFMRKEKINAERVETGV